MKLTIFGATGGIGRHLLDQALDAGHDVTAVVRDPGRLPPDVRSVTADLAAPDAPALKSAVHGADAVLSGLGPRKKAEYGIASRGTRAIVAAMRATGVRRVLAVSGMGISTVPTPGRPNPPRRAPGTGFYLGRLAIPFARFVLGDHYVDVALMEEVLRESGLDWTAVQVPLLTNRLLTGRYRTAYGTTVPGGTRLSRADAAHFMLRAIERPETFLQAVSIGY